MKARKQSSMMVSLVLLSACATTPVTDRRQVMLVDAETMHRLGSEAYGELRSSEPISNDQDLQRAVQEVGRRIAEASGHDYEWEFTVFDSDQMNAFCLPGGKVGVYTGILKVADTNAKLAAIIGHEIAHATARHGGERMSQALLANAGLTVANLALATNEYRQPIVQALGLGAQFGVLLPYSRTHESEADLIGLRYMAKAGYDPQAAVALWRGMAAAEEGARPPVFLSTHPHPEQRIEALQEAMPKALALHARSAKVETKRLQVAE